MIGLKALPLKVRMIAVCCVTVMVGAVCWMVLVNPVSVGESSSILIEGYVGPELERKSCDYDAPSGLKLSCYWAEIGSHRLSVAVLGHPHQSDDSVPLVYLAGGPGEGNNTLARSLDYWSDWYKRLGLTQDFVVVDSRGLSPSEPAWGCPDYLEFARRLWREDLSYVEEIERTAPVVDQCYEQLRQGMSEDASSGGIAQFSSVQNAADMAEVMGFLGYGQWDLLGVSYGTRVALVSALSQRRVRRIILDSPYLLSRGQLSDTPRLWAQAFDRYWHACDRGLWGCPADAKSESLFWRVFDELSVRPLTVTIDDWSSEQNQTWVLNGERMIAAIYSAFYSSELYFMVYPALQGLLARDHSAAEFLLESFYNQAFDDEFNNLIFWSTECNDNFLESEVDYQAQVSGLGKWASLFSADWQYDLCRNVYFTPGQKPKMSELAIPTLLAVGEWDPVTPMADAETLLRTLSNGFYLPLKDHGHAEFFVGSCAEKLIPWFLSASENELKQEWSERSSGC